MAMANPSHIVRSKRLFRSSQPAGDKSRIDQIFVERCIRENTTLASSTAALQALSSQILKAQDDERRRIARELHDSTVQNLAALSMTLGQIERDAAPDNRSKFEECRTLITAVINELRNFSYLLYPPMMEEIGFTSAVEEYAQGFEKRSGLHVQTEISSALGSLGRDREITLFRIIQEDLGNIQKHSGSSVASIKIFCSGEAIVLEIRDQRRGFPATAQNKMNSGIGIRSMRERIRPFGGTLAIESTGFGTIVRVVLPKPSSSEFLSAQVAC
jgi:two-component system, NarL family, sensor kinase